MNALKNRKIRVHEEAIAKIDFNDPLMGELKKLSVEELEILT